MLQTPRNADGSVVHSNTVAKNILVLYRLGDTVGQEIAEYYQTARSIPANNVHSYDSPWTDSSTLATRAAMDTMVEWLAEKQEAMDAKAIVLCGHWPSKGDGTNNNALAFDTFVAGSYYYYHNIAGRYTENGFVGLEIRDYSESNRIAPYQGIKYNPTVSDRPTLSRVSIPDNVLKTYLDAGGFDIPLIPVFRLDCSEVFSTDTRIASPSRLNFVKRFIDDAIAAENAMYSNVGAVLAESSPVDTMITGLPTRDIAEDIPNIAVYFQSAANEPDETARNSTRNASDIGSIFLTVTGTHFMLLLSVGGSSGTSAAVEPTWDTTKIGAETVDGDLTFRYISDRPANVFPAGADTITPNRTGKTYVAISDVFFISQGNGSYLSLCDKPELYGDLSYRQGAVVSWGMSCGAVPWANQSTDWEFNDTVLINVAASADALTSAVSITVDNSLGFSCKFAYLQHDGTGSPVAAEVESTSTQVIFYEDTGSGLAEVGRVTTVSGVTLEDKFDLLVAGAPANWDVTISGSACAVTCDSRCMTSLKNGACIAIGAIFEPLTAGAPKMHSLLSTLWNGSCIAEAVYNEAMVMTTMNGRVTCYGDPLYRPFGHF